VKDQLGQYAIGEIMVHKVCGGEWGIAGFVDMFGCLYLRVKKINSTDKDLYAFPAHAMKTIDKKVELA